MRKLTRANKKSNNTQTYYQNLHCICKWCNLQAERDTKNIPVVYVSPYSIAMNHWKKWKVALLKVGGRGGGRDQRRERPVSNIRYGYFLWPHKSSDLWPRHAKTHRETDTSVHLRFFRQGALFDELEWVGDDGMFWCNGLFRHDEESWKRDPQNTDINSFVWHTRGETAM